MDGAGGFCPLPENQVTVPELALVMFTVMDKDVKTDDFVAQTVVPVSTLRKGYRSLRLYSNSGTVHGDFENASLLCRFALSPRDGSNGAGAARPKSTTTTR